MRGLCMCKLQTYFLQMCVLLMQKVYYRCLHNIRSIDIKIDVFDSGVCFFFSTFNIV